MRQKGEILKKKLLISIMAGALLLCLCAGCGGNPAVKTSSEAVSPAAVPADSSPVAEAVEEETPAALPAEESGSGEEVIPAVPQTAVEAGTAELLVVSFGTPDDAARAAVIGGIEGSLREAFPDWIVRRAFVSREVRDELADRGIMTDSLTEALERAMADEIGTLVVLPALLSEGDAWTETKKEIDIYSEQFDRILSADPIPVISEEGDPAGEEDWYGSFAASPDLLETLWEQAAAGASAAMEKIGAGTDRDAAVGSAADGIPEMEVLLIASGEASRYQRMITVGTAECVLREHLQGWQIRLAFTDETVTGTLAGESGIRIDDVPAALERAAAGGCGILVAAPLYPTDEETAGGLEEILAQYQDRFEVLTAAEPLLAEETGGAVDPDAVLWENILEAAEE